jgi:hypothetical protein
MMSNVKGMTATARAAANNQAIIELLTQAPIAAKRLSLPAKAALRQLAHN